MWTRQTVDDVQRTSSGKREEPFSKKNYFRINIRKDNSQHCEFIQLKGNNVITVSDPGWFAPFQNIRGSCALGGIIFLLQAFWQSERVGSLGDYRHSNQPHFHNKCSNKPDFYSVPIQRPRWSIIDHDPHSEWHHHISFLMIILLKGRRAYSM